MSNRKIKIAISGKSGCGNTTVSKMVSQALGFKLINYTFHNMADEKGIPFETLCRMAEEDNHYDLYLDETQVKLASEGDCVLGSRLAIWLLKDADLKVFLTAAPEVRAGRIAGREGRSLEEAMAQTEARDKRDNARYKRLYNIDNEDFSFADLIIDTEQGDQHYVADLIIQKVKKEILK